MNRLMIGNWPIVYPTPETMLEYRFRAESHLHERFDARTYTSPHEINTILKTVLNFFESEIDALLMPYLCRPMFQGVQLQYKVYCEIYRQYISHELSCNDMSVFEELVAPSYGRAVKFILERMVLLRDLDARPEEEEEEEGFHDAISALFCCAMQVVELSIQSDLTYGVAPLCSAVIIHPPGSDLYLQQCITDEPLKHCMNGFGDRWRMSVRTSTTLVPEFNNKSSPEYYSPETFGKAMDKDFQKAHGFSFTNAVNALVEPLASIVPPQDGLPVVFEPKERILALVEANTGLKRTQIEKIFDGFVVKSGSIIAEGRKFWDPKSESRARRRGIFEVQVNGVAHFSWCRDLYAEALQDLELSATYQDIPIEWNDEVTAKGVSRLSNAVGKWFEKLVESEFKKLGFQALSSKVAIGLNRAQIRLPGEIDVIAYSQTEKILVVGECKRIRGGTEPSNFYDEIQKFLRGSKPFISRLNMKADFVKNERERVCAALETEWRTKVAPEKFVRMFITRRPTMASCFLNVPCVALDELIAGYRDSGSWPFAVERLD